MITSKKMRRMSPEIHEIRRSFPQSWFTKAGPGVERNAQDAFRALAPHQRAIAVRRGWAPAAWLDLPPIPRRSVWSKAWQNKQETTEKVEKPGVVRRVWNKLKSLFGGGK